MNLHNTNELPNLTLLINHIRETYLESHQPYLILYQYKKEMTQYT